MVAERKGKSVVLALSPPYPLSCAYWDNHIKRVIKNEKSIIISERTVSRHYILHTRRELF